MDVPGFLDHLRRDRRGIPVPWINRWGPEDLSTVYVAPDPNIGGQRAIFAPDTDNTAPDFTAQNMARQREAMYRGLCQVCGRPVSWAQRVLVIADMSVDVIEYQGRQVATVTQPWLHPRCGEFAVEKCPALIRRQRGDRLTVVPVPTKSHVALLLSVGWVEGPLADLTRRDPAAMWVKALLLRYVIQTTTGAGQ